MHSRFSCTAVSAGPYWTSRRSSTHKTGEPNNRTPSPRNEKQRAGLGKTIPPVVCTRAGHLPSAHPRFSTRAFANNVHETHRLFAAYVADFDRSKGPIVLGQCSSRQHFIKRVGGETLCWERLGKQVCTRDHSSSSRRQPQSYRENRNGRRHAKGRKNNSSSSDWNSLAPQTKKTLDLDDDNTTSCYQRPKRAPGFCPNGLRSPSTKYGALGKHKQDTSVGKQNASRARGWTSRDEGNAISKRRAAVMA